VVDEETVDAEAQEKSANDRTRESDGDVSFSRCISFFSDRSLEALGFEVCLPICKASDTEPL
jgi:hypothetical protein